MLKRITLRHWAWIHLMVILGSWAMVISIYTPVGVYAALQEPLISIWTLITIVGAIAAIVGLLMSLMTHARAQVISVSVELFGLILAAVGPFTYLAAQISLATTDDFAGRIALVFFAYFGLSILIYRILIVIPRFRKEAHDVRKDV